ncbi:hypothetical protein KKA39_02815, partial [Patescibacteria group bacterium]|nr:hypothetical protein [Patescibacteria group bacterium]MBU1728208.1 hypothetical protein [Patescibacteria group bacterium]
QAGYSNATGSGNVFLGSQAGYYETGSNKLFIDNQDRTDEATARTNSLIYGIFDATPANQKLTINGMLNVSVLPAYDDDAGAGGGGLTTGDFYQTTGLGAIATAGVVMVKQ